MKRKSDRTRPSLESLIESEDLGLEVLHPGGLEITRELAELCHIQKSQKVLDVASGTGESACYIAENFGCEVVGVDASEYMVEKAKRKAENRGLNIGFRKADAHNLPFEDGTFDVVISECTTCLLDKEKAISEMVRVVKSGGYVGIHDVCWREGTPEEIKQKLADIEGEKPETLEGWKRLFERAGLKEVIAIDKSYLMHGWGKEIKKKIGIVGQIKIFLRMIKNWGISGYKAIRESERIFQSEHIGYGIIVGRKP
jgi:ubiquinone/menaquinone biosynthesis C-methylase UbiE